MAIIVDIVLPAIIFAGVALANDVSWKPLGDICYSLVDMKQSFDGAQGMCVSNGGQMLSIPNVAAVRDAILEQSYKGLTADKIEYRIGVSVVDTWYQSRDNSVFDMSDTFKANRSLTINILDGHISDDVSVNDELGFICEIESSSNECKEAQTSDMLNGRFTYTFRVPSVVPLEQKHLVMPAVFELGERDSPRARYTVTIDDAFEKLSGGPQNSYPHILLRVDDGFPDLWTDTGKHFKPSTIDVIGVEDNEITGGAYVRDVSPEDANSYMYLGLSGYVENFISAVAAPEINLKIPGLALTQDLVYDFGASGMDAVKANKIFYVACINLLDGTVTPLSGQKDEVGVSKPSTPVINACKGV